MAERKCSPPEQGKDLLPPTVFEIFCESFLLSFAYVGSLRSFLALHNFEFHGVAFLKALVAFSGDGAVVDEHVRPVVPSYEPVAFCVVEPLHSTFQTIHVRPLKAF